jgi:hypothetical protein
VLAVVLMSHAALAQPAPSAPSAPPAVALPGSALSDSLTGPAKADYDAAKILFEAGDNSGALLKLKSSYDASKDPRLLWNMAACEKNLRHYAEVARLANRYLADGAALISEQDRADATDLLNTVKGFVVTLTVNVDQPDATILMDEQPLGKSPLPGPVQVDMGPHKFRITKAGFLDFTSTPELQGGLPFQIAATLVAEKHEGRLRVLADANETIQVDHKTAMVGLWEGVLPSGTHSVFVSGKGKRAHQTDVVIQDNDLTNLHVTLEDEAKPVLIEKSSVPAWLWVAGGVVVVGGGIGAYLLLKPDSTTKYQSPTQGTWGAFDI